MVADLVTASAVIALASALGGAILEYVWHAIHHNKRGHR